MLIAQMTDIHIGFDPDAEPEELNRTRFRETLARLIAQPNQIDMLVLSGDLTDHGDAESFAKICAELSVCDFPIHPLIGNHDTREELLRAFPQCPSTSDGFIQYAVEQDGLRILMLDTFEEGRHGGAYCEARSEWLKRELADHPDTPTLIFMHHPPVVAGIDWMDPGESEPWMVRLHDALQGQDQVQAIHCGHLHRPISTRFAGIPLSVTPSVAPLVSLDLRAISPDTADGRTLITTEPPVYALHRWDGRNLVTHYEMVSGWDVLEIYRDELQGMIAGMFAERK